MEESLVIETAQALRKALKSDARPLCLVSLLLETGIKKGGMPGIRSQPY